MLVLKDESGERGEERAEGKTETETKNVLTICKYFVNKPIFIGKYRV